VKLQITKNDDQTWTLRAAAAIAGGSFISEFVGEIMTGREGRERLKNIPGMKM
jgi:hypothetical protein